MEVAVSIFYISLFCFDKVCVLFSLAICCVYQQAVPVYYTHTPQPSRSAIISVKEKEIEKNTHIDGARKEKRTRTRFGEIRAPKCPSKALLICTPKLGLLLFPFHGWDGVELLLCATLPTTRSS